MASMSRFLTQEPAPLLYCLDESFDGYFPLQLTAESMHVPSRCFGFRPRCSICAMAIPPPLHSCLHARTALSSIRASRAASRQHPLSLPCRCSAGMCVVLLALLSLSTGVSGFSVSSALPLSLSRRGMPQGQSSLRMATYNSKVYLPSSFL
jgi:hypothetical protein